MALSDLTSSAAVLAAIRECDALGREAFLAHYGFSPARSYFVLYDGRQYDSKAIAGAAYGHQYPNRGPLRARDFSGGDATIRRVLEALGFVVIQATSTNSPLALEHYQSYTRKDVHDIFAPDTPFTPQSGTWGLQGIVAIPNRPGDFVFFVTFGQEQAGHVFEEGITEDGVLSWQSQPRQTLGDRQIQQFIQHDDAQHTIYLFLRTHRTAPYTYLGTLAYLSHDSEREAPVYFQWQLKPPFIPAAICTQMHLALQPATTPATHASEASSGLIETPPPRPRNTRGVASRTFRTRKQPNYAEADAQNRALGMAGELLVLAHEQQALRAAGHPELARRVHHVSAIEGDGAGYDILSYTDQGRPKYIEVKTTKGPSSTSFYMSSNEVAFSQQHADNYYLYRVYEYDAEHGAGNVYIVRGAVEDRFTLTATEYRVTLAADA